MMTETLITRLLSAAGAIGRELSRDKYLVLFLCVVLLLVYLKTRDQVMQQLLLTAVGGFLGLMRAGLQNNTGEGKQ